MAAPAKAARKGSKGQRPCGTPGCTLLENHVGNCTSQQVGGRRSSAQSTLFGGYSVELPASQPPSTKPSPKRLPAAVSTTATATVPTGINRDCPSSFCSTALTPVIRTWRRCALEHALTADYTLRPISPTPRDAIQVLAWPLIQPRRL